MVQDAVKDDGTLQLTMIKMLLNTKDSSEALYWAKKFNIPREKWPWILSYEEEQNESESNIINNYFSLLFIIIHKINKIVFIYNILLCRYK